MIQCNCYISRSRIISAVYHGSLMFEARKLENPVLGERGESLSGNIMVKLECLLK